MSDSLEVLTSGSLQAQVSAEIDVAVATAHKFPRDLARFKKKVLEMATIDKDTAASCFYKLKRKNRESNEDVIIEGPSIRMAEIVAAAYGNLRYGSRIVEVGASQVIAQGIAHDLEGNVTFTSEVRRGIVTSKGKRYSDDMITMTCNAASAIASRNAMFKAVPVAMIRGELDKTKKAAVGDGKDLSQNISNAFSAFSKIGVSKEMVLDKIGRASASDITVEDLELLLGTYTSIMDKNSTIQEEFGAAEKPLPGMPQERSNVSAE